MRDDDIRKLIQASRLQSGEAPTVGEEDLAAFLDGRATAGQRTRVESWLASSAQGVDALLECRDLCGAEPTAPPAGLTRRIQASAPEAGSRPADRCWPATAWAWRRGRGAAALVAVALSGAAGAFFGFGAHSAWAEARSESEHWGAGVGFHALDWGDVAGPPRPTP